jgi:hypothetical protein
MKLRGSWSAVRRRLERLTPVGLKSRGEWTAPHELAAALRDAHLAMLRERRAFLARVRQRLVD